jgi:2-polyprenyl-3-methyl-5-hydroxy-6-metoxy-1,4-benzoquinol methylase
MNKTRMAYVWEQIHRHCLSEKEEPPSTTTKTITEPNSPPLKILDVGCGGGLACESLARMFRSSSKNDDDSGGAVGAAVAVVVVGIDPSPDLIDVARAHALLDESRTGCIRYHNVSAEQYAEQYWNQQQQQKQQEKEEETVKLPLHNKEKDEVQLEGPFDVICLLEVVEHVQDPALLDSILFSLVGLLKEGGLLFISTINRTWKSHLLTIVGAEYVMGYLPVGTHRFDLYKSPDEIQSTLSRHGLRQLDVTGMIPTSVPIPFPPTWLLPKTTTGPCAARPPLPLALLSGLLTSPSWDWKLDPTDTDVNWIGTYQKKQTSTSDASEERN